MKFCLINNLFPPYSRGGAEKIVEIIANGLKSEGDVLVISTQPRDETQCKISGNIEICRVNPHNIYYLLNDYKKNSLQKAFWHFLDLFCRRVCKKADEIMQKNNINYIFTHNLKGLGLSVFKSVKKSSLPYIHTLHDYQLLDPHGSMHRLGRNLPLNSLFYRLYRYFSLRLINQPDLVISPSKFVLEKHKEYGFFNQSKNIVLPNPIVLKKKNIKKQLSNKLRLLYLGQIEDHKGVEFLINSFMDFKKGDCQLTIAGDGSKLEIVRKLSKQDKRINVLGKVSGSKLDEILNQTDLLIVPSIWWENSPTVIYEAYSHNIPVLVSDSGGSKELVKDGETGWIFESSNKKSLQVKLNLVLNFKDKLDKMGNMGYEFIKEFSDEKYIKKLMELCLNLKK